MKKIVTIFLALLMLAMSSVALAATDLTGGVLQSEGTGALGQSAAMGYRAAKVDAMRNLLEEIQGVQIDAETTVEQLLTTSDIAKSRVSGVLKGARVVNKWQDMEGYHVTIEVPAFGGVGSLASAVIPEKPQVPLPEPAIFQTTTSTSVEVNVTTSTSTSVAPAMPAPPVQTPAPAPVMPISGGYTGLIVDCTGLGLSTAMAPGIYADNGKIVYGLEHFNHDQVINRGYVGYSRGMSNVSRAGSNPMIVKAVSLRDNSIRPVISNQDAVKILSENRATGFLNSGNVVFVK